MVVLATHCLRPNQALHLTARRQVALILKTGSQGSHPQTPPLSYAQGWPVGVQGARHAEVTWRTEPNNGLLAPR